MLSKATIRSAANPLLRRARAALAGREPELVALEGDRLVDDALASGLALECVLVAAGREARAAELEARGLAVARVETGLLERASGLRSAPGILALARTPGSVPVAALPLGPDGLVLVAAGIANPGNLGALARSAEAFGACALAVVAGGASPWSDKALRGSMGSLLRLPVHQAPDAGELARALAARGVRSCAALARGGLALAEFDFSGPLALWIAGEIGALPAAAREFEGVTIPMAAGVESLNVSVAASILLHAAGRVGRRA